MKPDDYRKDKTGSGWGRDYKEPDGVGYTVIPVLQFLNGEPWDEVALAYVHALRPSKIRVVGQNGAVKLDAMNWRVTVGLHADDRTIVTIRQEVAVGLTEEFTNGHELDTILYTRLKLRQLPKTA